MFYTGIEALDNALFDGEGIPPGSLVEIYGASDSGKTGLALWTCRTAQQSDALIGWVCAETNLSIDNIQWAGVDPDGLLVARQTAAMPGLEAARLMVEEGIKVVVVDSVAALLGDEPGLHLTATLARGLPDLKEKAEEQGALVILTNQERSVGLSRVTTHAGASRLVSRLLDAQILLRSGAGLYRGGVQRGMRLHFHLTKNSQEVGKWGRVGKFNCYWEKGLKDLGEKSIS